MEHSQPFRWLLIDRAGYEYDSVSRLSATDPTILVSRFDNMIARVALPLRPTIHGHIKRESLETSVCEPNIRAKRRYGMRMRHTCINNIRDKTHKLHEGRGLGRS